MTREDKVREAEIRGSDPSELTTQMMVRQIAALKELLTAEIEGIKKAIDVAHDDLVRVPTEVQKQISFVREVQEIKIANLEKQFELIEKQRVEQKSDTRLAIDDALKAARELGVQQNIANNNANAKTEASFSKQIEQQAERINDIKERQAKTEGRSGGLKDFGSVILAAAAILIALLSYLNK